MSIRRFYCEKITRPLCELTGSEAHHLISVLRLKKGETIELFDGNGLVAEAVIKETTNKKVTLEAVDIHSVEPKKTGRIIIAVSIAKGQRFDWLIEKCTELGVDRICPVLFERTVKFAAGEQTIKRWHNLSISAAKQAELNMLPIIDKPAPLKDVLNKLKTDYPSSQILLGQPDEKALPISNLSINDKDVVILIGSEGGLSITEQQICQQAAAITVRLTDSVLRVETAAVAFASVLTAMRCCQNNP